MAIALMAGLAYVWVVRRRDILLTIDITDNAGDYGVLPEEAYTVGTIARHIH